MTQEEYNKQMRDAEIQLLNDKLKVKGLEPSEIQRINDQILDAEIKARDELRRLDEQSAKDEEKRRKEQAEETFSRLDKEYQMQVEAATMYHYETGLPRRSISMSCADCKMYITIRFSMTRQSVRRRKTRYVNRCVNVI